MPSERQRLIKALDKAFSEFIRLRATDDKGRANCFTCGTLKFWREGDAGHFQSRGKYSTRWDEINVQFQCKRCNGFRGGEQYQFAKNLDAHYGEGTADDLVRLSNQTRKYGAYELASMAEHYRRESAELKRKKGL